MVNEDLLNMDDDMNKFCVSWFASRVAGTGIKQVIASWNNHSIPGNVSISSSILAPKTCRSKMPNRKCILKNLNNIIVLELLNMNSVHVHLINRMTASQTQSHFSKSICCVVTVSIETCAVTFLC